MKKKPTTTRQPFYFRLRPETRRLLETIKVRDGVPFSAQIERALLLYAKSKGVVA